MNAYDLNDSVRLSVTFDVADEATDPTTVKLLIKKPDSTTTTYIYGDGATINRVSAGVYYADITLPQAGTWTYCWRGTGAVRAATPDHQFIVKRSVFA